MKQMLVFVVGSLLSGCGGATTPPPDNGETAQPADTAVISEEAHEKMRAPSQGMVPVDVVNVFAHDDDGVIVVLREREGQRRLVPMVVGNTEGRAIAMRLTRQKFPRPMTHDLFETVIGKYEITLIKVEIDDLRDAVFLAHLLFVDSSGTSKSIDSRPSDGIALALGMGVPIYMSMHIIDGIGEADSGASADSPAERPPAEDPTGIDIPPGDI